MKKNRKIIYSAVLLTGILLCFVFAGCEKSGNFSDKELDDMRIVDEALQNEIFDVEGYDNMTVDERKVLAGQVLNRLEEKGLVLRGSLLWDDDSCAYSFQYASGALGAVMLKEWNPLQNGVNFK